MEDFERSLRDKMEQASLKELFPGFDKDGEWAELEEQLQPRKKRMFLLAWSHAAAILIGIVGGYFLLKEFYPKSSTEQVTINVPPSQKIKPNQNTLQVTDTLKRETVLTKKIKTWHPLTDKGVIKHRTTDTLNNSLVQNNEPGKNVQKNRDSSYDVPRQPVYTIATTIKHRQQAISMLDVMNEDRQFMINEQLEGVPRSKIFNQIQHQIANTEGFAASDDKPYVLRLLFAKP